MRLAHILQRQRYRLHLRFVALCQAISLEPPYYTKIDIQVTPIKATHHRNLAAVWLPQTLTCGVTRRVSGPRPWSRVAMVEVRGFEPRSFRLYC